MLTPYQKRQKDEEFVDQVVPIEKEQKKKVKKRFQNKCVSSQKIRMRKEEGATVAASHLPSLTAGSFVVRRAVLGSKQR